MSTISTHVLDTARGRSAIGVAVVLEHQESGAWTKIASAQTDQDGRVAAGILSPTSVSSGTYRLRFDTAGYFRAQSLETFFPEVAITFTIRDSSEHHHVPLLLSPFGYSTYRGS